MWFSSLPNWSPPPAPKGGLPGARGRDSTVAVGSRSLFRGPPAEEGRTLPGAPLTFRNLMLSRWWHYSPAPMGWPFQNRQTLKQLPLRVDRLETTPRQAGDWRPDFQPMASPWRPNCGVNMVVAARWLGRPVAGVAHFPALVPSTRVARHFQRETGSAPHSSAVWRHVVVCGMVQQGPQNRAVPPFGDQRGRSATSEAQQGSDVPRPLACLQIS